MGIRVSVLNQFNFQNPEEATLILERNTLGYSY